MRKLTRPLAVTAFFVLSLTALAFLPIDPRSGSDTRTYQPHPPFPQRVSLDVFQEFDLWFVDRTRIHLPLLSTGVAFHAGLLRRSTDRRLIVGRDGWLFWTDDFDFPATMVDFRGHMRFTEAEVKTANQRLLAMRDQLATCDARGLIVIAPNKQSIYGEYLDNAGSRAKTRLDDLLPRLDPQARKMLLDLRKPLRAAKAQDPSMPLYFKTDTHWNDLGAYFGYRAIIEALAKQIPVSNLSLAAFDQFTTDVKPFIRGDLSVIMLSARDWFPDVQVGVWRKTDGNIPFYGGSGRLILLGDSFSLALKRYFLPHFAEVRSGPYVNTPAELKEGQGKPSAVVFEMVERYLPYINVQNIDWTQFCPH